MKKVIIVLLATITLTSCMSSQGGCAAYASAYKVVKKKNIERGLGPAFHKSGQFNK